MYLELLRSTHFNYVGTPLGHELQRNQNNAINFS
jgi:hypothetical protein